MKEALAFEQSVMQALRAERIAQKLSHQKLADKARMSKSMVIFAETGRRHPTLLTLHRLATALDVDLATLIQKSSSKTL